jgi:hypothetical protein
MSQRTYTITVRQSTVVFTSVYFATNASKARRQALARWPGFSVYRMWRGCPPWTNS